MKVKLLITIILFSFLTICTYSKDNDTLFVAFWNVENLFDTIDDPEKNDEEWLPESEKEWTEERLEAKMNNLSRIIRSMNDNRGPDILGVCEVENEAVLQRMIDSFLSDMNYAIAYAESPDNRGIDNGLIFRKDLFTLFSVIADTVNLPDLYPTRVILNANLLTNNSDTIMVFVNHWPSRRGGQEESEINRIAAAQILKNRVDYYFSKNPNANIIIMGDFNDDPVNISLTETLGASPLKCDTVNTTIEITDSRNLYNLSYQSFEEGFGSYKYRDTWNMLDQIIVSHSLLVNEKFHYICNSFEVYMPEIMLTKSGRFEGTPFPTFGGRNYLGGYSDHFAVISKFYLKGLNK